MGGEIAIAGRSSKDIWLEKIIDDHVLPGVGDIPDAREALAFFSAPRFRDQCIRLLETYARVRRHCTVEGKELAETGSRSGVSFYLENLGIPVAALSGDFRYSIDAPSDSVDVLFSFEVLEHIKDQEPQGFADLVLFNFSGARKYFAEMFRVLRQGGTLVVTTPNACSLRAIARALDYEAPWVYWPHVKEYPPAAVIELSSEAGFFFDRMDTMFAYFFLGEEGQLKLREIIDPVGASRENRGDVAFFLFRKPE
jgi:SAM-dependent methyltransferase